MKITIKKLKSLIKESLNELGSPRGALRQVRGSNKQQYKIGKVEDENIELSFSEANQMFPGAVDAWAEIVPHYFPDFPFADDPFVVRKNSLFFKEGKKLVVASTYMPQVMLATWDPTKEDWDLVGDESDDELY